MSKNRQETMKILRTDTNVNLSCTDLVGNLVDGGEP